VTGITGWHLELTRRCPLRCPACPRTFDSHIIKNKKQDINFSDLKRFFNKKSLKDIRYLFFQGNLGDPIYHPQFHEISEYFFHVQHLSVVTNGIQTLDFWNQVLETWPQNSLITLSIDGLEDTNSIYRVGSSWNKINSLFELISKRKRKCKIEWKYIVFEHNKHQIAEASMLSQKLGIDSFRIQQSRSLDEKTNLNGKIKEVIISVDSETEDTGQKTKSQLIPFCRTLDLHYINSLGEYFPCCWWPGYYEERNLSNERWKPLKIKDMTINQAYQRFNKFSSMLEDGSDSPDVCKINCTKCDDNSDPLKSPNSQINRQFLSSKKPLWE
jgi:MoaA/NifB/PqqE/SkfB family radical SAM enzyme